MVAVYAVVPDTAVALIEVRRCGAIGQKVREDRMAVHGDADLRPLFRRLCSAGHIIKTIGDRMIVIAHMGVYMAAAIVKWRDGGGGAEQAQYIRARVYAGYNIGDLVIFQFIAALMNRWCAGAG